MDTIRWKIIKGYPSYRIFNNGYVFSIKSEKFLKAGGRPYLCVRLVENGNYRTHRIHVLVASHFIKRKNKNLQVNHIDGNKLNNKVINLEWVTAKQNARHRTEILNKRNSKLTKELVIKLREERLKNKTYREIAEQFNISKAAVFRIIKREVWSHI